MKQSLRTPKQPTSPAGPSSAQLARQTPGGLAFHATKGKWTPAPHLNLLNRRLIDAATGRVSRLVVTMPPRHGKSMLTSHYFPVWYVGTYPDRRVLLASYEADFAASWGRKARDVMEQFGPSIFGVKIRKDSAAASRWDIDGRDGGMMTSGVGGPLTGKGAHLLLIDDPVKNAEEAGSDVIRQRTWDWFVSSALTRLEPGGSVILIQTRWNEDDLAGRLLAQATAGGEKWELLNLPALAEADDPLGRKEGAALWPDRYDAEALDSIRRTMNEHWFAALYQQRPRPLEGGLFKEQWLRYCIERSGAFWIGDRPVAAKDCRRFIICDPAISTKRLADYSCIGVWLDDKRGNLILADMVRAHLEAPELIAKLKELQAAWNTQFIGIESTAYQLSLVQFARRDGLAVKELHADKDKVSRALTATVKFGAGQVFIPENAPWRGQFEAELLSFPHGANDDCVDVVSYACLEQRALCQQTSRAPVAANMPGWR